jgi:hypothetical protein
MHLLFLLVVPAAFAYFACKTNKYALKTMQTLACLLIVLISGLISGADYFYYLCAAFFVSVFGDYFLSYKHKNENFFVYGIALYFLAHVVYLLYIVMSFDIRIIVFVILIVVLSVGYLTYYFMTLKKLISGVMAGAALSYLIISCVVLALALSAELAAGAKVLMTAGIALIVISDTIIAETDFKKKKHLGK